MDGISKSCNSIRYGYALLVAGEPESAFLNSRVGTTNRYAECKTVMHSRKRIYDLILRTIKFDHLWNCTTTLMTSFYGSSSANSGKDALNTPDVKRVTLTINENNGGGCAPGSWCWARR